MYEALTTKFCEQYPDVEFQITDFPLALYWHQVINHLHQGDGPDIFFMHNEQAQRLRQEKLLLPYTFTSHQKEVLTSCYPKNCDQIYYYDFAYLTSLLYVNGKISISPLTSWNDLCNKLKKQTQCQYDFGCSINMDAVSAFFTMVALQHQEYGRKRQPETRQWIKDFFHELHVYEPKKDCKQAFVSGEIAMVYSWGWFAGYLNDAGADYQVLPLAHEKDTLIYDRRNSKSSCAISINCQYKEIANAFLFEFLSNTAMQKYFCLTRKVVPLHQGLQKDEDILLDSVIMAQGESMGHTLLPVVPQTEDDIQFGIQQIKELYDTK